MVNRDRVSILFTFQAFFVLMGVVCVSQLVHHVGINLRAFLGCHHTRGILQVEQLLCCLNGLQSVGNHDHCNLLSLLLLDFVDRLLDLGLALRVKSAGSLIEDKDLRLLDQSPSDCNSLLLTTR